MKLVYLKKFNEAYSDECSFDTFKEVLFELSDHYDCQFMDYSYDDDPFYDCVVTLPGAIDAQFPQEDFLNEILPPYDDPEEVNSFQELNSAFDEEVDKLKDVESKISQIIERGNKIKEVFRILEVDIIPRLQSFDNCGAVTIGYEECSYEHGYKSILRICFDLPQED